MMDNIIIAIDGPAGSGKSTVAKLVADKLNINYIDTGAMYRAITYKCLINNVDFNNTQAIIEITRTSTVDIKDNTIYLDNKPLKEEIRTMDVNDNVSNIAKIKEVRLLLVDIQRQLSVNNSIILDGRDIGSYVFPNADYKFFLVATPEERGARRFKELKEKGYDVNLDSIIDNLIKRDKIDSSRNFAPLIKSADAIEIDTTCKGIDEVTNEILSAIKIK